MSLAVMLPKLGMNMEAATLVRWLKHEGDSVERGEPLAEVETDKTTFELEAAGSGTLRKLLVAEGARVAVHQPLALIGEDDEDLDLPPPPLVPPKGESHEQRVRQVWVAAPSSPPGPSQHPGSSELPSRLPSDPAGRARPDPDAIRARLAARGVLGPSIPRSSEPAVISLVVYGAGLGARQILEVTRLVESVRVIGLVDDDPKLAGIEIGGLPMLGGFSTLADLVARRAVDGVVLSFHSDVRRKVHRRIASELALRVLPLVDPRAIVGLDVRVDDGALVEAGAVVGPSTVVGEGTIVDIGVTVAHDCHLGPFSHLSPGCTLSGIVSLTENVLVGAGAVINSTVTVGRNVIIAPGAAVMHDIPDDVVVSGIPARVIGRSRRGS